MPRDSDVYLLDILEAIERIGRYTEGMPQERFRDDQKTIDAVVRNLEIVGEAVKALPGDIRAKAPTVEWQKIAGLRDMLIHAYFVVDVEIVWDVVTNKLQDLKRAVERLLPQ